MPSTFKRFLILLLAFTLVLFLFGGWSLNEVPAETMAKMHELGEVFATPNEHHQFLERFTGDWVTTTTIMGMPPDIGTATHVMIFGGRFLDGTYTGNFMGLTLEGRMTLGFDNYKNKFIASFVDNLGTSIKTAEGLLDQTGNVLSLWGTMDEWLTDEHDKPVLYRLSWKDNDHFELEIHDLAIVPGDTNVVQVNYKRAGIK